MSSGVESVSVSEASERRTGSAFPWNPVTLAAGVVLAAIILAAVFAPELAPHDPNDADLLRRLQPPSWMADGDAAFVLGCDGLGRDILSRLLYGARISIAVAGLVILIATSLGIVLGLAAGYLGGVVDLAISAVIDILLGFPYLIFAIALMAMTGPGLANVIMALVYKEWVIPCRLARGETRALKQVEFVEAARALGMSTARITTREILPNILSPVMVVASVRMAHVIILEASLSFLGLGAQAPAASWGSMVADGREFMLEAWWVSTFPGLAILLLVLAVNLFSQGVRDALDPRSTP